jgi:hypothetical protein
VWWVTFVSFVLVGVVWNLAQPRLSGADEPAHFLEAEAVWSGQLVPPLAASATLPMDTSVVHVRSLSHDDVACYNHHPNHPASCVHGDFKVSRHSQRTTSYVGREPPLPAYLNGLPVFLDPGATGLFIGRLLDAVLESACLATAIAMAATRRRPLLIVGVVVALTPEALAQTGVLGSSQLEIAAASVVWTTIALLMDGEPPTKRFVALLGGASVLLALARPISFVWLALAAFALLIGCDRRRLSSLLRSGAVQVGLGIVAVAVGGALVWYFAATAPDNPLFILHFHHVPTSRIGDLSVVLGGVQNDWLQTIGQTGGDYSGPWWMTLLWTALLGLCVGAGLLWSSARRVVVIVFLLAALFIIPTAIKTIELPHLWEFWHGRYDIPTLSGVVIIATSALDRAFPRVPAARLATGAIVLAGIGQIAEFAGALRRFCVGVNGTLNPLEWKRGWHPPVPAFGLLLAGIAIIALAYALICMHQRTLVAHLRAEGGRDQPRDDADG